MVQETSSAVVCGMTAEPPTVEDGKNSSFSMLQLDEVFNPATRDAHFNDIRHVILPNGLRMEYAMHGEDDAPEKVVMIMGMQGEKESWLPLVSTFLHPENGTTSKFQLVTFDNRGVGGSDKPWGWYSTTKMARDALMLMDHLRWPRAHIVGASMGGMIAQELAYAAPERVASLALMVTSPGFRQGGWPGKAQMSSYLAMVRNMFIPTRHRIASTMIYCLFPEDFLQETIEPPAKTPSEDNTEDATAIQTTHSVLYKHHMRRLGQVKMSISGMLGHYTAVLFHNMQRDRLQVVADADFPIMIIGAKQDRMLHPKNTDFLLRTLKSKQTQAIIFENSGHDVHVQHRLEVSEALDKLFASGMCAAPAVAPVEKKHAKKSKKHRKH
ncbi:unnamed protein product [Aphanomyces euteiches]